MRKSSLVQLRDIFDISLQYVIGGDSRPYEQVAFASVVQFDEVVRAGVDCDQQLAEMGDHEFLGENKRESRWLCVVAG